MLLNNLIKDIDVLNNITNDNINISGIEYNSANVSEGDLFICIKGYKTDGHKYLPHAVENGAIAAIVEEVNEQISIPQYVVKNSRIALAKLSATFYDYPSEKMNVIGITATSGKTTTTFMLNSIFEKNGIHTGLIGSVNLKIGDTYSPATLTTPDSLELQQYFKAMLDQDVTHVMMEVSSAALELHRVDSVDFDIVSLNNIHREHIDMHGSFEKYVEAKTKLIKEASNNSIAILSLDNKYAEELITQTDATTITFGVKENRGDFSIKDLSISTSGTKFTVVLCREIVISDKLLVPTEFEVEIPIPGLHIASNAMVAIIIALLNDVPIKAIQSGLKDFKGVERRFEMIHKSGPIIVDDHCSNPGNIDVTFEAIESMDYRTLQVVYAIRGQRGKAINEDNAIAIAEWALKFKLKELVITKSVGYVTELDLVTDEEADVVMKAFERKNVPAILIDNLADAIEYGMLQTQQDDLLLLSGCQGMDSGNEIAMNILESKVKSG